jgi:hypothetical protein
LNWNRLGRLGRTTGSKKKQAGAERKSHPITTGRSFTKYCQTVVSKDATYRIQRIIISRQDELKRASEHTEIMPSGADFILLQIINPKEKVNKKGKHNSAAQAYPRAF